MRSLRILTLAFRAISATVAGAEPQQPLLTVLVTDRVGIGEDAVRKAAQVAQDILGKAGVPTQWITCSTAESNGAFHTDCPPTVGQPDLSISIVSKPAPDLRALHNAMGEAVLDTRKQGRRAYVFYNRVLPAADLGKSRMFRVLGHVMAHEIGHLLGVRHSSCARWGIMCGDWNSRVVGEISRSYLPFSVSEARTMQHNISNRLQSGRLPG